MGRRTVQVPKLAIRTASRLPPSAVAAKAATDRAGSCGAGGPPGEGARRCSGAVVEALADTRRDVAGADVRCRACAWVARWLCDTPRARAACRVCRSVACGPAAVSGRAAATFGPAAGCCTRVVTSRTRSRTRADAPATVGATASRTACCAAGDVGTAGTCTERCAAATCCWTASAEAGSGSSAPSATAGVDAPRAARAKKIEMSMRPCMNSGYLPRRRLVQTSIQAGTAPPRQLSGLAQGGK
jgi:hypothetical protein